MLAKSYPPSGQCLLIPCAKEDPFAVLKEPGPSLKGHFKSLRDHLDTIPAYRDFSADTSFEDVIKKEEMVPWYAKWLNSPERKTPSFEDISFVANRKWWMILDSLHMPPEKQLGMTTYPYIYPRGPWCKLDDAEVITIDEFVDEMLDAPEAIEKMLSMPRVQDNIEKFKARDPRLDYVTFKMAPTAYFKQQSDSPFGPSRHDLCIYYLLNIKPTILYAWEVHGSWFEGSGHLEVLAIMDARDGKLIFTDAREYKKTRGQEYGRWVTL